MAEETGKEEEETEEEDRPLSLKSGRGGRWRLRPSHTHVLREPKRVREAQTEKEGRKGGLTDAMYVR